VRYSANQQRNMRPELQSQRICRTFQLSIELDGGEDDAAQDVIRLPAHPSAAVAQLMHRCVLVQGWHHLAYPHATRSTKRLCSIMQEAVRVGHSSLHEKSMAILLSHTRSLMGKGVLLLVGIILSPTHPRSTMDVQCSHRCGLDVQCSSHWSTHPRPLPQKL